MTPCIHTILMKQVQYIEAFAVEMDPIVYDEQIGVMETILDVEELERNIIVTPECKVNLTRKKYSIILDVRLTSQEDAL